jgi:hypothetical protein
VIYPDTQTLLLDDRFFHGVLNGLITASLRIGERNITPGRLVFIATSGGYLPLEVYVERLIHTTFAGINDYDAVLAGYDDAETARRSLLSFYPSIAPTTPVTVIRFERV